MMKRESNGGESETEEVETQQATLPSINSVLGGSQSQSSRQIPALSKRKLNQSNDYPLQSRKRSDSVRSLSYVTELAAGNEHNDTVKSELDSTFPGQSASNTEDSLLATGQALLLLLAPRSRAASSPNLSTTSSSISTQSSLVKSFVITGNSTALSSMVLPSSVTCKSVVSSGASLRPDTITATATTISNNNSGNNGNSLSSNAYNDNTNNNTGNNGTNDSMNEKLNVNPQNENCTVINGGLNIN